jgi:hypothetical protein
VQNAIITYYYYSLTEGNKMRYTNIDGNLMALRRHQDQEDQDYRDDEIAQDARESKPMLDNATDVIEQGLLEAAVRALCADGWLRRMAADFDIAIIELEESVKSAAAKLDCKR